MTYIDDFLLPEALIPPRLRAFLEIASTDADERIEVQNLFEVRDGATTECAQMLMAVVPEADLSALGVPRESADGVVAFSVPDPQEQGDRAVFNPSVSGCDYIVASWGDGSFYTYNLAEKVWMALGLVPRTVGGEHQKVIFDDLSLPEFGVAEGEISNEFYWKPTRDVSWRIKNEYLRRYLWMRGAWGVRVFWYRKLLEDQQEVRALMSGETHFKWDADDGWCEVDLREHRGGLLLQVWGAVPAVSPELSPGLDAEALVWPDDDQPMTHDRASALVDLNYVYLQDSFLEKYEQSSFYDSTPIRDQDGRWLCSPSYRGQWSFTDCVRVGRNLIRVRMRELYKPKPDIEIIHAHSFAITRAEWGGVNFEEEHIVAKVHRFVTVLVAFDQRLREFCNAVGVECRVESLTGFSREELEANGWLSYPVLSRLGQVATLDMSQQAFLSRCKTINEILQKIPNGFLRSLLKRAGCKGDDVKGLGSLKLLQALYNIVVHLNENGEQVESFAGDDAPDDWARANETFAPLFVLYDLRVADAHEAPAECLDALNRLGFDIALVNSGYGKALDCIFDKTILTLEAIDEALSKLLAR